MKELEIKLNRVRQLKRLWVATVSGSYNGIEQNADAKHKCRRIGLLIERQWEIVIEDMKGGLYD